VVQGLHGGVLGHARGHCKVHGHNGGIQATLGNMLKDWAMTGEFRLILECTARL
jgi:hypothetical protein